MRLVVGAATDVGRVRDGNEDAYLVDDAMGLVAVADGMGGHRGGEVASATALEALRAAVSAGRPLRESVEDANRAVFEKAQSDERPEMRYQAVIALSHLLVGEELYTVLQRGTSDEHDFYRFFTARTFVRLATVYGAKVLGLEHEVGSLQAGKRADIVAVDLSASHQVPTEDPYSALVHTANQESVVMTMVAGRVLYKDGEYLSVDSERAVARAEEIQAKLRG
jgi:formylmethanofuran dehydrogenase subunit A